jgi:hypothetical protein
MKRQSGRCAAVSNPFKWIAVCSWLVVFLALVSCSKSSSSSATVTADVWVPQVPGASSSHHSQAISLSTVKAAKSGRLNGWGDLLTDERLTTVEFDMTQDLGRYGSITLTGAVEGMPADLSGGADAYLMSLSDGVNEFIHLSPNCQAQGLYSCDENGNCEFNSQCTTLWPSAYSSRSVWESKQVIDYNYSHLVSVNTFPNCNWEDGVNFDPQQPACAFNSNFFSVPNSDSNTIKRLRFGTTYTAKYALIAQDYIHIDSEKSAQLRFDLFKKSNTSESLTGAVDLNVILVGKKNVEDSRTPIGKRNLNSLIEHVGDLLSQTTSSLHIGAVHAIEWSDATSETFATLNLSQLDALLGLSSAIVPPEYETHAINLFLVNTISESSSLADGLTILGISGAFGGPPTNGHSNSGLAFSTFGLLGSMNAACPSTTAICGDQQIDEDFYSLVGVMAHEMGHYLGLFHTSENSGGQHDAVPDTAICTETGSSQYITVSSCRTNTYALPYGSQNYCLSECPNYNPSLGLFCAEAAACPFNNLMWWLSKNYNSNTHTGDGNAISSQQGIMLNYSPFVQ